MASSELKNRDYIIIDGENDVTVVATCPHCGEPFTIEGKPPPTLNDDSHLKFRCFCRGANGLSWNVRCCKVLQCAVKKKVDCNLNPTTEGRRYDVGKWNTIVIEEEVNKHD